MFGGYAGPSSYTKLLLNTNMKQLIQEKKPLPHGDDKPGYSDLDNCTGVKLIVETSSGTVYTKIPLRTAISGNVFTVATAAGFGDPIKRDPALAKKDLDNGLLTIETCRRIYCIEANYDDKAEEWIIDEQKTAELRADRRKERLSKGIPAEEWWKKSPAGSG